MEEQSCTRREIMDDFCQGAPFIGGAGIPAPIVPIHDYDIGREITGLYGGLEPDEAIRNDPDADPTAIDPKGGACQSSPQGLIARRRDAARPPCGVGGRPNPAQ